MTTVRKDWNPAGSNPANTVMQVFTGLAASIILFLFVAWTIGETPVPEDNSQVSNRLRFAPPPPPELEQQSSKSVNSIPRQSSKPIQFAKESFEFQLNQLDVDFHPQQHVDTLAKIDVDITQLKATQSDIEDMLVFERSQLDKGLQALFQPMPQVSKRTSQDHSIGLIFVVDVNGRVTDEIYILDSTDPELNADVLAGVKSWTFKPPMRNKKKVRAKARIRIKISPNNPSPWGN